MVPTNYSNTPSLRFPGNVSRRRRRPWENNRYWFVAMSTVFQMAHCPIDQAAAALQASVKDYTGLMWNVMARANLQRSHRRLFFDHRRWQRESGVRGTVCSGVSTLFVNTLQLSVKSLLFGMFIYEYFFMLCLIATQLELLLSAGR